MPALCRDCLTPSDTAYAADSRAIKIAAAAARLDTLRENWLNPEGLVRRVPEMVPGYPDRILPVSPEAEAILKKRTLTNLYNARPAWRTSHPNPKWPTFAPPSGRILLRR